MYSSKVVAAVGIAVLMVFNMDSIKPNLVGTKIETMKQLNNKFSISRMLQQSTEKIGAGMKNISGGIAENLEFDKGVYKDEKQRSKFCNFCLACIPGAGQMYLGFFKQGISLMSIFMGCCAIISLIGVDCNCIRTSCYMVLCFF